MNIFHVEVRFLRFFYLNFVLLNMYRNLSKFLHVKIWIDTVT